MQITWHNCAKQMPKEIGSGYILQYTPPDTRYTTTYSIEVVLSPPFIGRLIPLGARWTEFTPEKWEALNESNTK